MHKNLSNYVTHGNFGWKIATLDRKVNRMTNLRRFKSIGGNGCNKLKYMGQFEIRVKVKREMMKLILYFFLLDYECCIRAI